MKSVLAFEDRLLFVDKDYINSLVTYKYNITTIANCGGCVLWKEILGIIWRIGGNVVILWKNRKELWKIG